MMKVGNIVDGLAVIDVKRVNKLNLIQFLKEVDGYLQQGYKIDVNSSRQVGLVLQTDMYKTEGVTSEAKVESTGFKEELEPKNDTEDVEEAVQEEVKVEQKRQTRSKKSTAESKEDLKEV